MVITEINIRTVEILRLPVASGQDNTRVILLLLLFLKDRLSYSPDESEAPFISLGFFLITPKPIVGVLCSSTYDPYSR